MNDDRHGLGLGLGAYGLWGLFPLYWPLLDFAGSVELIAHRTVWSLFLMIGFLAIRGQWAWIRGVVRAPALLGRICLASAVLSFNWCVYIHGVNSGRVVEAALGFFVAPLAIVGTGVLLLGERLRATQSAAVALGLGAVLVLIAAYGHVPWIALALAGSWAVYAYLKKTVKLPVAHFMTVEIAVMFIPASACLAWLAWRGTGTFVAAGTGNSLMLITTGLAVTPLLLFAAAARRVSLSTLGLLQYLEPAMQFGIGVAILHEPMPTARWMGFALVWAALLLLVHDSRRSTQMA
ncbi:EamA family transporter RarD [Yinghuangia sp. YIM S10712]|uniref:EamA family transporter RarD n=1 Tax=Yinghuangia sp. YIM S10712 TaxID=3436930 RepID=UPI003F52D0B0